MESLSTIIEFVAKGGGGEGGVPGSNAQTGDPLSLVLLCLFIGIAVFALGALI